MSQEEEMEMSGWFNKRTLVRVKMLRGVENLKGISFEFCVMFKVKFKFKSSSELVVYIVTSILN